MRTRDYLLLILIWALLGTVVTLALLERGWPFFAAYAAGLGVGLWALWASIFILEGGQDD